MTNEDIQIIKEKYEHLKDIKEELLSEEEELKQLEENESVRRYLELKMRIESDKGYSYPHVKTLSDEDLLEEAISNSKISKTNNIYVCIDTFHRTDDYYINEYLNIECPSCNGDYSMFLPSINVEDFEKENIVLYPPKNVDGEEYFQRIRNMYFETAINYGCNKAMEKILYKKNMQASFK